MLQEDKLKEAQRLYETANADQRYVLERLFSELNDSKDEKIKKELIKWMNDFPDEIWRFLYKKDIIAWLEKHDENTLVKEIKRRKAILLEEKETAVSYTENISLSARIAMLEELLAFVSEKE